MKYQGSHYCELLTNLLQYEYKLPSFMNRKFLQPVIMNRKFLQPVITKSQPVIAKSQLVITNLKTGHHYEVIMDRIKMAYISNNK